MKKHLLAILFIILISTIKAQPITSIAIQTNAQNLTEPVSKLAIQDAIQLLTQACTCKVELNLQGAAIVLQLPLINPNLAKAASRFETDTNFPILTYPETDYTWQASTAPNQKILTLTTQSYAGISCGIYGLLQEKLGFKFYHPRQSSLPTLTEWPLSPTLNWQVQARFHKRGFHLHTEHPLELTEQLMDENYPQALADIKQYIDWLARNGQNYFEFNLLEGINRKTWPNFAKQFVDYAHSRGIIAGVDLSLHMVQQKTFMLYKASFRSKKKQIERNMAMINQANWDVWNMEFSTTEFSSGNVRKKTALQLFVADKLTHQYHVKLMGRKHVVKASAELGGGTHKQYEYTDAEKQLDKNRGILMHTVMFYNTFEEKAPVYRNQNLRHILDQLLQEKQVRETWYYPESAYWITFDNSVPMTLLPYLKARLQDIQLMDSLKVVGHITFSSGWEWGYWLTDWSIARWSFKQFENGTAQVNYPEQYMDDLFPDTAIQSFLKTAADLQQQCIKEEQLIRYLCPSSVTDEFPKPYNLEFQPRPRFTYKYIRNKATALQLDSITHEGVLPLHKFAQLTTTLLAKYQPQINTTTTHTPLLQELQDGLAITALRAQNRASTLAYLIAMRKQQLDKVPNKKAKTANAQKLVQAEAYRQQALAIVYRRQAAYRYPVPSLAQRHKSHTAYEFGYLYPVSNLHFWKREQLQAQRNKWSPFYKNIFDLFKIIGITN